MKHFCIRTAEAPGQRLCEYIAICGYSSTEPKEFTPLTNPSSKGVTCEACQEKLNGSVAIMAKGT